MKSNRCKLVLLAICLWVSPLLQAEEKMNTDVVETLPSHSTKSTKSTQNISYCLELEKFVNNIKQPVQPMEYIRQFIKYSSQCESPIADQYILYSTVLKNLTLNHKGNLKINNLNVWKAFLSLTQFISENISQPSLNQLEKITEQTLMKDLLIQTTGTQPFFVHNLVPPYQKHSSFPVQNSNFEFNGVNLKGTVYTFLTERSQALCQSTDDSQHILLPFFDILQKRVDTYLSQQEPELMNFLYFLYTLQEIKSDNTEISYLNHWSQMKVPFLQTLMDHMYQDDKMKSLEQFPNIMHNLQLLSLWVKIYNKLNTSILTHCIVDSNYTPYLLWEHYNIVEPVHMDAETKSSTLLFMEMYKSSIERNSDVKNTKLEEGVLTFYKYKPFSQE